ARLDTGGAKHLGIAKAHQYRTLGVAGVAAADVDAAQRIGCAAAGSGRLGHGRDLGLRRTAGVWGKSAREFTIRNPAPQARTARAVHANPACTSPPRHARGSGMIRSMTAFASGERATRWGTLAAELRSVNHRFLELAVKAPEE